MTKPKQRAAPEPGSYEDLNPELSATPREEFVESPPFHRPLERNVAVGPGLVSICVCPKCGERFAYYIPLLDDSHVGAVLPDDAEPDCPRCTYADKTCPADLALAMQECRWLYDAYKKAAGSLGGASNAEIRNSFIKAHDVFWRYGPVLLRELEHLYGDQLTRGVHEIETGAGGG